MHEAGERLAQELFLAEGYDKDVLDARAHVIEAALRFTDGEELQQPGAVVCKKSDRGRKYQQEKQRANTHSIDHWPMDERILVPETIV
ncbi:MAG TPA: hypothetical protein VK657_03385 [Terriglobales bacterium]|nr:hypothetical protein [Terriglobales bacterium]